MPIFHSNILARGRDHRIADLQRYTNHCTFSSSTLAMTAANPLRYDLYRKAIMMAARRLCWPPTILLFRRSLDLLFLASYSDVVWPMVTKLYHMFDGDPGIWVAPSPVIWRPKNIKISARFRTTSRLDREYLRNATRHCQSENGVANYGHSRTGKHNSMYVGPQMAKNRTDVLLTH